MAKQCKKNCKHCSAKPKRRRSTKKKHTVLPWLVAGVTVGGLALAHPSDKATAVAQPAPTPIMSKIRFCESSNNYRSWTKEPVYVNGKAEHASGGYSIIPSTWHQFNKTYAQAMDAPPAVQDEVARKLYAAQGTGPWTASKPCWGKA